MLNNARTAPVSFSLEALLLMSESLKPSARDMIRWGALFPVTFRLRPPVQRANLERALSLVMSRHAALRADILPCERYATLDRSMYLETFRRSLLFVPGMYQIRIDGDVSVAIDDHDPVASHEVDGVIDRFTTQTNDPLCMRPRATIVPCGPDGEAVLILALSHFVCDGWSARLIGEELVRSYNAFCDQRDPMLPPVNADVVDFATWQQTHIWNGGFDREQQYWSDRWNALGDAAVEGWDLPFAISKDQWPHHRIAVSRLGVIVPETRRAQISDFIAAQRLTAYALFRSAFAIALHVYTDKVCLAFWANFANRQQSVFERTVAWCSNNHLITVLCDPGTPTIDFCRHMTAMVREGQRHESLPLHALWQRAGLRLNTVLTRVGFDLVRSFRRGATVTRQMEHLKIARRLDVADLDVRLRSSHDEFALEATFNGLHYDAAGVRSLLNATVDLASYIAANPTATVASASQVARVHHDTWGYARPTSLVTLA